MSSPAPASTESDRLKKLKQQQEALLKKIRLEESRLKDQARKDETRRKIIVGAIALAHAERNLQFRESLYEALHLFVDLDKDRELIGLPPKSTTPPPQVPLSQDNTPPEQKP